MNRFSLWVGIATATIGLLFMAASFLNGNFGYFLVGCVPFCFGVWCAWPSGTKRPWRKKK